MPPQDVETIPNSAGPLRYSKIEKMYIEGLLGLHTKQAEIYKEVLPNCFIIGAAKSGTTTLAATLKRHKQVFLSRPKEPRFFGSDYPKGWEWYGDIFKEAAGKKVRIDATTRYTSSDVMFLGTPQLIANYIENPKFIYIVRHPLERIVSHWRHIKGLHPDRSYDFKEILTNSTLKTALVEGSMYFERISNFRKHFPDRSILCLTFEDMLNEPPVLLNDTLKFLGLKRSQRVFDRLLLNGAFRQHNAAGASGRKMVPKPEWKPELKEEVVRILSPDARRFLEYAGKPVNFWPEL